MDYEKMLEKGRKDPGSIKFEELREAFIKSDKYVPYADQDAVQELDSLVGEEDWEQAEGTLEKALKINPMSIEANHAATIIYESLGNDKKKEFHSAWTEGLLGALLGTGDGRNEKSAFVVIDIREEYLITGLLQNQMNFTKSDRSSVTKENGQIFDVWTLADEKEENKINVYFDATIPSKRLMELMAEGMDKPE